MYTYIYIYVYIYIYIYIDIHIERDVYIAFQDAEQPHGLQGPREGDYAILLFVYI